MGFAVLASAEVWSVALAGVATAIALVSLAVSIYSARRADRSASAAMRSAAASERSADSSERSVGVAERGVGVQSEALELQRRRDARERLASIRAMGPEWGAAEEGSAGHFISDETRLRGRLRNTGLMTAKIVGAWLDFNGQRAAVRTRCDRPQGGGGGWASTVFVPPQTIVDLDALLDGIDLPGDARPSIYIDYEQVGADTGLLAATIVLRRQGSTPTGHDVWIVGDIRSGVLP